MEDFERSPFVLPPRQERSRVALARIVAAAAELIARKGSHNFSMAEVAATAEIPLGSIYRRFKGKDDIIQAVLLDFFLRCEDTLRGRMQGHNFTSAGEVVIELAAGFVEMAERNEELFRAWVSYSLNSPELTEIVLTGRRRLVAYYADAISAHLQSVPERRRDLVIGMSYVIVASALNSKARGDTPAFIDLSRSDLAREVATAATSYLKDAVEAGRAEAG
jgi:AcrR family transcriptional regulator